MNVIIPIELRRDRDHRNIVDDMAAQLGDIFTVASLLGAVDTDDMGDDQVNATGYLLQSMISKAKKISQEHYTLWLEELEESQEN